MSWDVSIFAAESSPAKIEQPGEDLGIMPLGSCESVRQKLSAVAPQIDWKDPSWGILEGDGYIIEFNLGDVEPCDSVMLHIRGSGADNNLIDVLKAIPAATGWYVFDHTQEEWFHHSGIFFGAVPSQEFPSSWSHQAILLSPGAADDPERKLSLYWYTFESGMSEGHRSEGFAFESVPMPKPGTRHSLDLAIDQTGLTKVYWDGQELPKLVRDGNRHRPHYWPGGIGLLNGIGTTRFHRFWLLQGNERKLHGALNHQPDRSGDPLRLR